MKPTRSQLPLEVMLVQEQRDWHAALTPLLDPRATGAGSDRSGGLQPVMNVTISRLDRVQLTSLTAHRLVLSGFCLFEIRESDLKADLSQIVALCHRGCLVVAAGNSALLPFRLCFRDAGCHDVVTSFSELGRVAKMIRVASRHQPYTYGDWKSDIVDRLPWQPAEFQPSSD